MEGSNDTFLLKQTLLSNNIINYIFNDFQVSINKDFTKIQSVHSHNDKVLSEETWKELNQRHMAPDSFEFDDDDLDMDELMSLTKPKIDTIESEDETIDGINVKQSYYPELIKIDLLVKSNTISINKDDQSFRLPSVVRSACILPGLELNKKDDEDDGNTTTVHDEDSLLLSLQSGYLLLIKFFKIGSTLKPFVVQDWCLTEQKTRIDNHFTSRLSTLGKDLYSHCSGLSVVTTSLSNNLKFFARNNFNNGILTHSCNFFIDGIILDSCYLETLINDNGEDLNNHIMFLSLVVTSTKKYQLRLFEWWCDDPLESLLQHSPTLLPADFPVPLFMIPLKYLKGVILLLENGLQFVGLNYIFSHDSYDLNFVKFDEIIGSIISYYKPKSNILRKQEVDEFLVASSTGNIYCVIVKSINDIQIFPIFKVRFPISSFTFERIAEEDYEDEVEEEDEEDEDGDNNLDDNDQTNEKEAFKLIYTTDKGSSEVLLIHGSLLTEPKKSAKSLMNLENWSPLMDFQVIKHPVSKGFSYHTDEEFWCLSGTDQESSLWQLRLGHKCFKETNFKNFNSVHKIFNYFDKTNDYIYFIFSYPYKSQLCKFNLLSGEMVDLSRKDEFKIFNIFAKTILFNKICSSKKESEFYIHITEESISVYDFNNLQLQLNLNLNENLKVLHSSTYDKFVAIITRDQENNLNLEVLKYEDDELINVKVTPGFLKNLQPSLIKFIDIEEQIFILVGLFNGDLILYKLVNDEFIIHGGYNVNDLINKSENDVTKEEHIQKPLFLIPHDLICVSKNNSKYLVMSSRDGYYSVFMCQIIENILTIKFIELIKISDCAVNFNSTDISDVYYLSSKTFWKLNLSESIYPKRCLFVENSDKSTISTCFISSNPEFDIIGMIRESEGFVLTSITKNLTGCNKKIKLLSNGKKFIFMEHLSLFVIISGEPNSEKIMFVDHRKFRKLKHIEISPKSSDKNISSSSTPIFEKEEYPISLSEWKFEYYKENCGEQKLRMHVHLLLGCFNKKTGHSSMKVFEIRKIKKNDDKVSTTRQEDIVTVTKLFGWTCEKPAGVENLNDPIYSIKQFSNGSILYSVGSSLMRITYNYDEKKFDEPVELHNFTSNINLINVNPNSNEIIVSTLRDTIYVGKINEESKSLELVFSDHLSRNIFSHCLLSDNKLITSDKLHCSVNGISLETYHSSLDTGGRFINLNQFKDIYFCKSMSFFIPRLSNCSLSPIWKRNSNSSKFDKFLSCGVNGEVVVYTKLNREEYMMLNEVVKKKGQFSTNKLWKLNQFDEWFNDGCDENIIDGDKLRDFKVLVDGTLELKEALNVDKLLNSTLM
ncbi:hypothetical protein PACTADRAFT_2919 [Pachysolen tannophilus NRRL Y-2460]|uniref:Cleavage/polyadenylation specificity factor A subunit N-terminal domain-containing protein n=1 Tax=Pachysolen tannophilus NRRL Y-2460 TaxID=669874 RepID=A0A1E4TU16_PACTA|nr:hypothetical protein PACTADRAFT_2919 [Pachysolen tannophilus NRRL Y-2460]